MMTPEQRKQYMNDCFTRAFEAGKARARASRVTRCPTEPESLALGILARCALMLQGSKNFKLISKVEMLEVRLASRYVEGGELND